MLREGGLIEKNKFGGQTVIFVVLRKYMGALDSTSTGVVSQLEDRGPGAVVEAVCL